MPTKTLSFNIHEFAKIRPGDRIVQIDDSPATDITVTKKLGAVGAHTTVRAISAVRSNGIELNLYPGSTVERSLTVERDMKLARRTVHGVHLVQSDPEVSRDWQTEDGRFRVWFGEAGLTSCDRPHPVRTGAKTGYQCPGGTEHFYSGWQAWDTLANDYVDGARCLDSMSEAVRGIARTYDADKLDKSA